MSDDLSGPTSDVGSLYRAEMQRRGVPMTNANLQMLINESRRNPGIVQGLEGVQGMDPIAQARQAAPAMPTPPMAPQQSMSGVPSEGAMAGGGPINAPPQSPSVGVGPPEFGSDGGVPPSVASPAAMASVINSTQPHPADDMMNGLGIDPTGALAALILGGGAAGGSALLNKFMPARPPTAPTVAPAPTPTAPAPGTPIPRAGMPQETGTTMTPNRVTQPEPTPNTDSVATKAAQNATVRDQKQASDSASAKTAMAQQVARNASREALAGADKPLPPQRPVESPPNLSSDEQAVWDKAYKNAQGRGFEGKEAAAYAHEALKGANARAANVRGAVRGGRGAKTR